QQNCRGLDPHPPIQNMAMGVESTAILLRWVYEPEMRPFSDWRHLIVLVAQTGNEMPYTKVLAEAHLFPILRQLGVRVVQVAKASASKRDGYRVLADTRQPEVLYTEGYFKLSQNLLLSGTVPRLGRPHICAQRWKGEVLDAWLADSLDGDTFGPYLGYNGDETKRVAKSDGYGSRGFDYRYPLVEWGWSRADCLYYIYFHLGVIWAKSACNFCPFQDCGTAVERFQRDPEAGAHALFMEANALAHNPRMHLFSSGTAYDLVVRNSATLQPVLEHYEALLEQSTWGIYHVHRIYRQLPIKDKPGKCRVDAERYNCLVAEGNRAQMEALLAEFACEKQRAVVELYGKRFYVHERVLKQYPAWEEFFVVAVKAAQDKCRNLTSFRERWQVLTGELMELKPGESQQISLIF
ncbi:MAG: hypothetical protein AAFY17_15415, partial [Cyanobacteria bacterium J06642_11]